MSDMNIAVEGSLASNASSRGINKADVVWMLGLYGTAIGAGVLFLP
ncbi:TPA: HAAAP family serine/threonine permease, partial [Aeromonas hydrophila]|nr:HAAAP family serine/threonine permease [Aeromonas hydrophila]